MWTLDVPILEKIIRPIIVYFFLLLALRMSGKRSLAQMSPFDLVVLLILSNIVQNAMIGNDNSVTGGLIGATALLSLNYVLTRIVFKTKHLKRALEGRPTLLVHNGKVIEANMQAAGV